MMTTLSFQLLLMLDITDGRPVAKYCNFLQLLVLGPDVSKYAICNELIIA